MANWKEPKNDYKKEDQVVPEIFNTLAENERYLQEKKITTEQVQDAVVTSTQATSRTEIGGSETVKGFFGKVRKWFADLKALAFKGTVATADIDNSAVTSAKIASSAVTTTKINDKAVTDAKINSVSASKVTGLHKVATSGDYNDLINKPSLSGGGFNFKKYVFYKWQAPSDIEEGLYLASAIYMNAGSLSNSLSFGTVAYNKSMENGCYSNISSAYFDGQEMKVQLKIDYYKGKTSFSILQSRNEEGSPYTGFDADGSFLIFLYKLSDLGKVEEEDEESGGGTWQVIHEMPSTVNNQDNYTSTSINVYIPGLKKGDAVKITASGIFMRERYDNESYFYNAPGGNMVYGFTYDGQSNNILGEKTGWYEHKYEYEYPSSADLELSSETPYVGKVGLVDYSTANVVTIKVSCKSDNYLTIEWSDKAGFYIDSLVVSNVQAKR